LTITGQGGGTYTLNVVKLGDSQSPAVGYPKQNNPYLLLKCMACSWLNIYGVEDLFSWDMICLGVQAQRCQRIG